MSGAKNSPPEFPTPWKVASSETVTGSHVQVPTARWASELAKKGVSQNQARMPDYLRIDMRPNGFLKRHGLRPVLKVESVAGAGDSLTVPAELAAFCPTTEATVDVSVSTKAAFNRFHASRSKLGLIGAVGGGVAATLMGLGAIPALGAGYIVAGAIVAVPSLVAVAVETLRPKH
jgi:hypothetical protein